MEIIHIKDVCAKVGLCRSMVFSLIADANSDFPHPISLTPSGKRKGFLRAEIDAWLERRIAERDAARH